jgi:two-component system KDP operon response regulator KdpE
MKILIVEDSALVVESVTLAFQLQWADVELVSTAEGKKAIDLVESERPDLVLLDVGLPDIDGYKVLEATREFSDIPVIMLTARDETMDKVKGLELGADDYVTKPFDYLELLARIRSVLRRLDMPTPRSRLPSMKSGDLEVDFQVQEARLAGQRLDLTPTEYKLLYHLVRNAGRILTHETLLSRVWGREYSNELDYLRVYIRRLREKLKDDPAHPTYIRTERGTGYRFMLRPSNDGRLEEAEGANQPSPSKPSTNL